MTFHEHQLSVATERGERTAPTVFSIPTTSRLPSAATAASAAASQESRRSSLPLPSPLRSDAELLRGCISAWSVNGLLSLRRNTASLKECWEQLPNTSWSACSRTLPLANKTLNRTTRSRRQQSDVKKATYVVVGSSRKVKENWRVETVAPLPFPVFLSTRSFFSFSDFFFFKRIEFKQLVLFSFWTDLGRAKDFQAPRIQPTRPALHPPLPRSPSVSAQLSLAEMMMYFWVSNASAVHQVGLYAIVSQLWTCWDKTVCL